MKWPVFIGGLVVYTLLTVIFAPKKQPPETEDFPVSEYGFLYNGTLLDTSAIAISIGAEVTLLGKDAKRLN